MPPQPRRHRSLARTAQRATAGPSVSPQTIRPADFHVTVDVVLLSLRNDLPHIGVVQRNRPEAYIDQNQLQRRNNPHLPRRVERVERHPQHHWALPGGHVGNTLLGDAYGTGQTPDTTLVQAALRVLQRETNLSLTQDDLHQVGAFGDADRDPRSGRTISVAYVAIVGDDRDVALHPNAQVGHVSHVQFRPIVDVLARPNRLEFDHEDIVLKAIALVRNLVVTTPLAARFCRDEFTLGELRRVYEALFHESLDSAAAAEQPGHADVVRKYLKTLEQLGTQQTPDFERTITELAMMMPSSAAGPDFVSDNYVVEFKGLASRSSAPMTDLTRQAELMARLVRQSSRTRAPRSPRLIKPLDPTNFARRIHKLNILTSVKGESRPTFERYGKPAALFRLDPDHEPTPFLLRLDGLGKSDSSE